MRIIGRRGGQHQLGVGRQLDLTRAPTAIGERHATDLRVELAGDQHVQPGCQRGIVADEFRVVLPEDHFAAVVF